MSDRNEISEARFALIVTGEALPADDISALLELQPTRVIHTGELLNRLPEIRAEQDEWFYVISLTSPMSPDPDLKKLLAHLSAHSAALADLSQRSKVTLRMFVQSDYAQMVYVLTSETLTQLHQLGLPLEISSLSWGEVGI